MARQQIITCDFCGKSQDTSKVCRTVREVTVGTEVLHQASNYSYLNSQGLLFQTPYQDICEDCLRELCTMFLPAAMAEFKVRRQNQGETCMEGAGARSHDDAEKADKENLEILSKW